MRYGGGHEGEQLSNVCHPRGLFQLVNGVQLVYVHKSL